MSRRKSTSLRLLGLTSDSTALTSGGRHSTALYFSMLIEFPPFSITRIAPALYSAAADFGSFASPVTASSACSASTAIRMYLAIGEEGHFRAGCST